MSSRRKPDFTADLGNALGGGQFDPTNEVFGFDVDFGTPETQAVEVTPAKSLVPFADAGEGAYVYDGRILLTPTGIELPDDMQEEDWTELGLAIFELRKAVDWWLIDWLAFGETRWGETYRQIAEQYGKKVDTLYEYVSSARKILIRNQDLSFAHHRLVTRFDDVGEQAYWLEQAASNGWTVKELRKAIHSVIPSKASQDPPTLPYWDQVTQHVAWLQRFSKRPQAGKRSELRDRLAKLRVLIEQMEREL